MISLALLQGQDPFTRNMGNALLHHGNRLRLNVLTSLIE